MELLLNSVNSTSIRVRLAFSCLYIEATNFGLASSLVVGDGGSAGEPQLLLADVPPASAALHDVPASVAVTYFSSGEFTRRVNFVFAVVKTKSSDDYLLAFASLEFKSPFF